MVTDIRHLRSGKKQQWLRLNADFVLEYHEKFGDKATRKEFNMTSSTLRHFLATAERKEVSRLVTVDDIAKLKLQIDYELARCAKTGAIMKIERDFSVFVDTVAETIATKYLLPALKGAITVPASLELKPEDDILRLDNFTEKSRGSSV